MKQVLILGAGMVAGPLADYFLEREGYRVLMTGYPVSQAEAIIAGRARGRALAWASEDLAALDQMLRESDLAVSMLPPALHVTVAEACLRMGRPLVTTSYISPQMAELDGAARKKDILLLNEIGEDPGIDHMGAKRMIDQVVAAGGRVTSLRSYGAGLPACEHNSNPFGYKFSWSPRGLMLAARTPAAYLQVGREIQVPAEELFDRHWLVDIAGLGSFESYPNRDSRRYRKHFGLDDGVTLYRGLLRYAGWCDTMRGLIALNLLDDSDARDFSGLSYREFTASLAGAPGGGRDEVAAFLRLGPGSDVVERLGWLGLFSAEPVAVERGANADVLMDLMLRRLSYEPGERDMILVHNEVEAEFPGRKERWLASMCVKGVPHGDSAMSRAVSLPAAIASRLILEGKIEATGVQMPTLPEIYEPVLAELAEYGFEFEHRTVKE